MLKLNENYPATSTLASPIHAERIGHVVVLLSTPDAETIDMTRRVWELAQSSGGAPIRLIGLCHDTAQEPGIRRTLITMASMLNHGAVTASIDVLVGNDWLQMLKLHLEPQDIVVCWDEPNTGMRKKPFSSLLQSQLDVPLYILSRPRQALASDANRANAAAAWMGFLAIILGFLLLQVKIYQLANQWAITLEIVSTAGEFWLIWIWNRLFP